MSCRPGRHHVWPGSGPSLSSRVSPQPIGYQFLLLLLLKCRVDPSSPHPPRPSSYFTRSCSVPCTAEPDFSCCSEAWRGGRGVLPLLWLPICCPPIPLPWSPSLCLAGDPTQAPSLGVCFSGTLWKLIRPALASSVHTLHAESTLTRLTGWPAPGF